MNQSLATRAIGMQSVTYFSHAAQITLLFVAGTGVLISLLSLVI
jgi:hypothetical protein